MSISETEVRVPLGKHVAVSDDALTVDLSDGRTIFVPLVWFPRLSHATPGERANWRWIARGQGIHWPMIDEDISIEGLIAGRKSAESQRSLQRWLKNRS